MELHINMVEDIAWAWKTGKPLAALCGFTRVLKEDKHDKRNQKATRNCGICEHIAASFAATGQAMPSQGKKTVAEIKELAKARPIKFTVTQWSPTSVTYTFPPVA